MNRIIKLLFLSIFLFSCRGNEDSSNNNPTEVLEVGSKIVAESNKIQILNENEYIETKYKNVNIKLKLYGLNFLSNNILYDYPLIFTASNSSSSQILWSNISFMLYHSDSSISSQLIAQDDGNLVQYRTYYKNYPISQATITTPIWSSDTYLGVNQTITNPRIKLQIWRNVNASYIVTYFAKFVLDANNIDRKVIADVEITNLF